MEMTVSFPGGARVDAQFGPYTVRTDQPPQGGGEGTAPTPFATFLASLATCAGIYVLGFCRQRDLPTEGIRITQRSEADRATGLVGRVVLDIHVPASCPEKSARPSSAPPECAVKKHLEHPPEFRSTPSWTWFGLTLHAGHD
jgi:ribosomal protein S12 methylthiotransferase accessory factor